MFVGNRSVRRVLIACLGTGLAAIFCAPSALQAQSESETLYDEVIFLRGLELGAGGRALALGGAYRALSDDLSGLYWNPAGLASVRRIEFGLGLAYESVNDRVRLGLSDRTERLSKTRLNQVGIVLPVPTFRGSLVFGLGYNQVHTFNSFGSIEQITTTSTYTADKSEAGRLGVWSFGGAVDLSPAVSVGASVQYWTGFNDFSSDMFSHANFVQITDNLSINSALSGLNALSGVVVRPLPWLRIGATLETPLKLKIEETYSETIDTINLSETQYGSDWTYHESRPFRFGIGAAALWKRLLLTSDAVLNDWSQVSFSDEPPLEGLTKELGNRYIMRNLRTTLDWHVGLEYWLPFADARVQAGYAYLPSPFKTTEVVKSINVINGGFSILLDPAFQAQASVSYALWDRSPGGWNEKLRLSQILLTLAFRM